MKATNNDFVVLRMLFLRLPEYIHFAEQSDIESRKKKLHAHKNKLNNILAPC